MIRNDFRRFRKKLRPEDFAIGPEGPDPAPIDLINKETWKSMISLPDDVSIRTSDYYGSVLKKSYDAWGEWISLALALQEAVEDPNASPIAYVALNAIDEMDSSIHNALVGFYRMAFSSMRNVLEQVTIGLYLNQNNQNDFQNWLNGDCELTFGGVANNISEISLVRNLEQYLKDTLSISLFGQKTQDCDIGFARKLYKELCKFVHGAPGFSNADLWQSNGPVFVPEIFTKWVGVFAEVYALGLVEVKLAQPKVNIIGLKSLKTMKTLFKEILNMVPKKDKLILKAIQNYTPLWI